MGTGLLIALVAASRIVVTEVMANPRGVTGTHMPEDRNEFVELWNASDSVVDLLGWTLDDGDAIDRLQAWTDSSIQNAASLRLDITRLDPQGYAVILDPEYTDTAALGGYEQPYRFGPGTLILTVGNTTIGDGLTTNDPATLASATGDTTTFGTPSDTTDSIPCDPGDGISSERIDAAGPDTASNWAACRDTAGCTPGAANSSSSFLDLAVTSVALADSGMPRPGEPLSILVGVANVGFCAAPASRVGAFLDHNGNSVWDQDEDGTTITAQPLERGRDTTVALSLVCPQTSCDLWARLMNQDDDSTNNFRRLTIMPAASERMLSLNLSSFSPDGDGFEESLAVVYRVPEAKGTLRVTVYNLGGKLVTTLFSGRPAISSGILCWNGLSSSAAPAPTGIYAVCLEYRNGGDSRAEKLPVVLLRK